MRHGAPLRLRVETQLGYKMVKYLRSIELIEDYRTEGDGQGGSREDAQFPGPRRRDLRVSFETRGPGNWNSSPMACHTRQVGTPAPPCVHGSLDPRRVVSVR